MAKGITVDVNTKKVTEYEFDFVEHVPTEEELLQEYEMKVKELIGEQYDLASEIGLTNECNMAIMSSEPIPQAWIDYREFVETCKDTAHMEVYGVERQ